MTAATFKLTTFRRSLAFAGAFAALAVATTSFAAPQDPPSVAVRYGDLDLSTAAGANTLYRRITAAARQVCPDAYSGDLAAVAAGERCRANAVATAVRELNKPQLVLVHAAHTSHG